MTSEVVEQPVLDAKLPEERAADRPSLWRRAIAGPTGLALLIAGGALLVRVAVIAAQSQGSLPHPSLYTAVVCVMAGVALVLVALPKIVSGDNGDTEPTPVLDG